jgi:hypothetical protein
MPVWQYLYIQRVGPDQIRLPSGDALACHRACGSYRERPTLKNGFARTWLGPGRRADAERTQPKYAENSNYHQIHLEMAPKMDDSVLDRLPEVGCARIQRARNRSLKIVPFVQVFGLLTFPVTHAAVFNPVPGAQYMPLAADVVCLPQAAHLVAHFTIDTYETQLDGPRVPFLAVVVQHVRSNDQAPDEVRLTPRCRTAPDCGLTGSCSQTARSPTGDFS